MCGRPTPGVLSVPNIQISKSVVERWSSLEQGCLHQRDGDGGVYSLLSQKVETLQLPACTELIASRQLPNCCQVSARLLPVEHPHNMRMFNRKLRCLQGTMTTWRQAGLIVEPWGDVLQPTVHWGGQTQKVEVVGGSNKAWKVCHWHVGSLEGKLNLIDLRTLVKKAGWRMSRLPFLPCLLLTFSHWAIVQTALQNKPYSYNGKSGRTDFVCKTCRSDIKTVAVDWVHYWIFLHCCPIISIISDTCLSLTFHLINKLPMLSQSCLYRLRSSTKIRSLSFSGLL